MSDILSTAKEMYSALTPSDEYKKAEAEINGILNKRVDTLTKILDINQTLDTSAVKRFTRQFELNSLISRSVTELKDAKQQISETTGIEQKMATATAKSIAQRQSEMKQELETLKFINTSGWGITLLILKKIWTVFSEMDKAGTEFRKTMGMMRDSAEAMQTTTQKVAINLMDMGVTVGGVYKSYEALTEQMGSAVGVTEKLLTTTSLLSAQLGVSEKISAEFMRNLGQISNSTTNSQTDMVNLAGALSTAAQVPLSKVMADVANHSDTTLALISKIPGVVVKAAVEFARLNTSLQAVSSASAHILDFTSNIQEELEACVLLGHNINMQKARELAYAGKLEESNAEIVRIARRERIENMDYFQKLAFAKMTGRSLDELLKMVHAEEDWNDAKLNGTAEQKKQIENYELMHKANNALLSDRKAQFAIDLATKSNQEYINTISNQWKQIITQIGSVALPAIKYALIGIAGITTHWIVSLVAALAIWKSIGLISNGMNYAGAFIPGVRGSGGGGGGLGGGMLDKLKGGLSGLFGGKGAVDGAEGKGRFQGIMESVANGIKAFSGGSITKGLFNLALGGAILLGFGYALQFAVPGFKAFAGVDWGNVIYGTVALGILSLGLMGLGALLADPLTLGAFAIGAGAILALGGVLWGFGTLAMPAANAFKMVGEGMDKTATGLAKLSTLSFTGVTLSLLSLILTIRELSHTLGLIPTSQFDKLNSLADKTVITSATQNSTNAEVSKNVKEQTTATKEQKDNSGDTNTLLQGVIDAIAGLRKDLNDGKIAINLDGSRVSTYLARSDAYKGSFSSH